MLGKLKFRSVLAGLACLAVGSMTGGASAVTAEVAKKCAALTSKAYPPRVVGNPAAGSAKGTGSAERSYFSKCVTNGGKMEHPADKDDQADKKAK
jgi:hypothetical protein